MGDWTEGQTPYDILGLTNGPEATDAEIRKVRTREGWASACTLMHSTAEQHAACCCRAPPSHGRVWIIIFKPSPSRVLPLCPSRTLQAYKVLALKKHPDKNKDNPNAGTEAAVMIRLL